MVSSISSFTNTIDPKYRNYVQCLTLALATALGSIALVSILQYFHLNFLVSQVGNSQLFHDKGFIAFVIFTGITIMPIVEESLMRGLPIFVLKKLNWHQFYWPFALISSLGFSLLHGNGHNLPLVQLLFGIIAFNVAYKNGLRYSIFLHILNNVFVFALGALMASVHIK